MRGEFIMEIALSILIVTLILIYDFILSPKICKKKIYSHINNIGGNVIDIERLTLKEYLYCVNYIMNGKPEKAIVRFNIFYESSWK
jgi:hypothetical protein